MPDFLLLQDVVGRDVPPECHTEELEMTASVSAQSENARVAFLNQKITYSLGVLKSIKRPVWTAGSGGGGRFPLDYSSFDIPALILQF